MPIPSENSSTERLLNAARYHLAMISADPATSTLAEPVKEQVDSLKAQWLVRHDASEQEVMASALLDRADLDLDQACRALELEALMLVEKDRSRPEYRALFPNGLVPLIALKGTAQSRQVEQVVTAMRDRVPVLAEKYATTLLALATRMNAAEKALADAQQVYGAAFAKERLLRADLIRQLRRNEGALLVIYPGKKSLVRAFFPRRRTGGAEQSEQGGDGAALAPQAQGGAAVASA
ncbi:MAG: hypothetical protein JW940_11465 [Polyangiaceae bacterium]|nr:hypothetical protein [Polyangiaceae bacterium]